jgi:hypothetical protein
MSESVSTPGVIMRIFTPRRAAFTSACTVSSSGTKYELDK